MARTRTDELEIATAMAKMYTELNPDMAANESMVLIRILKDIRGEAEYPYTGFAKGMITYLEYNSKAKQYTQFKACQKALVEWGIYY